MRPKIELIKNEEKENNVVDFSEGKLLTLTGGKGPHDPNFLSSLSEGSAFLTKKGADPGLMEWHVAKKLGKAILLTMNLPDGNTMDNWVDPDAFCRMYSLFEVIREGDLDAEFADRTD